MAQEGPHCHRIDFLGVKSGSVERRERSSHPRSEPDEFCQKMEPGEVDGEPSAALLELARSCRRGTKLSVLPIFWGEEWAATCREPRVFGEVKQVRERGTKLRIVWSVDGETQTNKIDDLAMPSFDLQVHEHVARARYVQIAGGEDGDTAADGFQRMGHTVLGMTGVNTFCIWTKVLNLRAGITDATSQSQFFELMGMDLLAMGSAGEPSPCPPPAPPQRTSPRRALLGEEVFLNESTDTGGSILSGLNHQRAHALSLRSLGRKLGTQLHCVSCGQKTTTYCSACPANTATCVPVHAPRDARGKEWDCLARHCLDPTARCRSAAAIRNRRKRSLDLTN